MSEDVRLVDSRGRRCPQPVLDLARAAAAAPPGTRIDLLADDPAAPPDVRAWCGMRGHTFLGALPAADHHRIAVRTGTGA